jgi:hypothetical protein
MRLRARILILGTLALTSLALLGSSSASATALCKTATSPCSGGTYGAGTVLKAVLKEGEAAKFVPSLSVCNESTIELEVTNAGGEFVNVSGNVLGLTVAKCGSCPVSVLKAGTTFSIADNGGGNGNIEINGVELTAPGNLCGAQHCIYSGSFTTGITLVGGAMAGIDVAASIPRTSGPILCGTKIIWGATFEGPGYTVVAPEPLYVSKF